MKIKAVIFDKDGVIVNTSFAHLKAWNSVLKKYDIVVTSKEYQKMFAGEKAERIAKRLLGKKLNKEELKDVLQQKSKALFEILKKDFRITPGVIDFIKNLRNKHIPIALATGSRMVTTEFMLNRMGLRVFFDVIVTAEHIAHGKPDPEVFLLAAERLHVFPGECVVFEDSLQGVEAAKRAGMKVILVTTTHKRHEIPHEVDMDIPDFTKITVEELLKL